MKKKEVENIIKTIFDSLNRLLQQIDRGYNKKHIHNFRIEIKKLKALLALINTDRKKNAQLKIPARLKSIYSTAGKIRELQILSETLKKTNRRSDAIKKYKQLLQSKKKAYQKKLHRQIQKINIEHSEKKLTKQLSEYNTPINTNKFFTEKNQRIYTILSAKQPSEKDLHEARKNIKDILYANGFLKQPGNPSDIDERSMQPVLKNQENIANQLGQLNDMRVAISLLKIKRPHKAGHKRFRQLQSIKRKWEEEKNSILKKIHEELNNLFIEAGNVS